MGPAVELSGWGVGWRGVVGHPCGCSGARVPWLGSFLCGAWVPGGPGGPPWGVSVRVAWVRRRLCFEVLAFVLLLVACACRHWDVECGLVGLRVVFSVDWWSLAAAMETRRAYDGQPYTLAEYISWYGEAAMENWNASPEVRQHCDGVWYTQEEYDAVLQAEFDEMVLDGLLAEVEVKPAGSVAAAA